MRPTRLSGALLVLGLVATIISSAILLSIENDRRELDFQQSSASVLADIQTTFDHHSELIEQLAVAISIALTITRDQFVRFIEAAERTHSHPSVRAVEWIPVVGNDLRDEFEQRAIVDGFEDLQITQRDANGQLVRLDERSKYYPVFHVEPLEDNEAAVGFGI